LREQAAERLPGATFEGRLPGAAGFDEAAEPALKALAYRYRRPAP
jgi:23S rRNA (cytosine1962-C5)-methyltransferase